MSKHWEEPELDVLRAAFYRRMGVTWSAAVNMSMAGFVRKTNATGKKWAGVAAEVGTRDANQCKRRFRTEHRRACEARMAVRREQEQERRVARMTNSDPVPQPEPSLPLVEAFRPSFALTAGRLAAIDVSPYLGTPTGRIVLSFNGRGAA